MKPIMESISWILMVLGMLIGLEKECSKNWKMRSNTWWSKHLIHFLNSLRKWCIHIKLKTWWQLWMHISKRTQTIRQTWPHRLNRDWIHSVNSTLMHLRVSLVLKTSYLFSMMSLLICLSVIISAHSLSLCLNTIKKVVKKICLLLSKSFKITMQMTWKYSWRRSG